MQCPVDGSALAMARRQGVEIDYCPTCRGVWLDRGELDKIVERNERAVAGRSEKKRWDLSDFFDFESLARLGRPPS